jgi:poly-beta-1,6-N-acetyl-D-glucosamine synthase
MTGTAKESIVVGIMAYNEATNIRRAIQSILDQTIGDRIGRIIVVASGCTDETAEIVAELARHEPRVVLIEQPLREGKTVALNAFLAAIHEPVVIVPSADLVLEPTTLEKLIEPLHDPRIGMVGSHPIPTNTPDTLVGFAVTLMWELHDRISRDAPKMGELVAFRNAVPMLDPALLSDELSTEQQLRAAGLGVAYAPEARVYNRGPQTLREFMAQRDRWITANLQIERIYGTTVSTLAAGTVLRALRGYLAQARPRYDWLLLVALLEVWARVRARFRFFVLRDGDRYRVWEPLRSTKTVVPNKP